MVALIVQKQVDNATGWNCEQYLVKLEISAEHKDILINVLGDWTEASIEAEAYN